MNSSRLDEYIQDVYRSGDIGAWYAALALSLALPDICGAIEYPGDELWERYGKWCNAFVTPRDVNLTGADLYVLRCSFLHTGTAEIQNQRAFKFASLGRISLTRSGGVSPNGVRKRTVTPNIRSKYVLPVGDLCEQIVGGAGTWQRGILSDAAKVGELNKLLEIHDPSYSPS